MIQIQYDVERAGWAICKIGNEEKTIQFAVSYLRDSLQELAQSAIDIKGKDFVSVIFMDEPGEYVFLIRRLEKNILEYELRWYEEWSTWNMFDENNFELTLKGKTTISKYINQVRRVLIEIVNNLGEEEYRSKWVNYDFPVKEFEILK